MSIAFLRSKYTQAGFPGAYSDARTFKSMLEEKLGLSVPISKINKMLLTIPSRLISLPLRTITKWRHYNTRKNNQLVSLKLHFQSKVWSKVIFCSILDGS